VLKAKTLKNPSSLLRCGVATIDIAPPGKAIPSYTALTHGEMFFNSAMSFSFVFFSRRYANWFFYILLS